MTDSTPQVPPPAADLTALPEVRTTSRHRISSLWAIPLAAGLIGLWLVYDQLIDRGPRIEIAFESAEGLEVGSTKIRFKDVRIGWVTDLRFSPDLGHVLVDAEIDKDMAGFIVEGSRFWVVRPRVGLGGVSGLNTLISGVYIAMEPGKGPPAERFHGLESPPVTPAHAPGLDITLLTKDLGSLNVGSPVYFRRIPVGQIESYELDPDHQGVRLRAFIKAPYQDLVRRNTGFWNTSGLRIKLDADGVDVRTESLEALIGGGIAFAVPDGIAPGPAATSGAVYTLHDEYARILEKRTNREHGFAIHFAGSLRGLAAGAPVEYRGIRVGSVRSVSLEYDAAHRRFTTPVLVDLDPGPFATAIPGFDPGAPGADPLEDLIAAGLRAQLRTANLLTGQRYIDLAMHPDAPPAPPSETGEHPRLPAIPTDLERFTETATRVLDDLRALPLGEVATQAIEVLQSLDRLLDSDQAREALTALGPTLNAVQRLAATADTEVARLGTDLHRTTARIDAGLSTLAPDSRLVRGLERLVDELGRAARSLRILGEYLERHPEALLRGKDRNY